MASGPQMLRCAACGHVWTYTPTPALEPLSIAPDLHVAPEAAAATGVMRPSSLGLIIGILLLTSLTGAFLARTSIVATWPHVSPLFEFLGLTSQPLSHSLKLTNVHSMEDAHGGVILMGEIENMASQAKSITSLHISALGPCTDAPFFVRSKAWLKGALTSQKEACPLATWTHSMSQTRLLPQEKLSFQTQPQTLPKNVQQLAIEF